MLVANVPAQVLHGANRLASNSLLEAMVFAHRAFLKAAAPSISPDRGGNGEDLSEEIIPKFFGKWDSSLKAPLSEGFGEASFPDWDAQGTTHPREMILITQSLKELQSIMSDYVGIVRTDVRLARAMKRLDLLFAETEELYRTTKVSPQL